MYGVEAFHRPFRVGNLAGWTPQDLMWNRDPIAQPGPRLLLIAAGRARIESLRYLLAGTGWTVDVESSLEQGRRRIAGFPYGAVVLDWEYFGEQERREFATSLGGRNGDGETVLVAIGASPDPAAANLLAVPEHRAAERGGLAEAIRQALDARKERELPLDEFFIGRSAAIRAVMEQVRLVAPKDTTVLITGETGTGKERVSRAIHMLSRRRRVGMVSVNCAGIPATLLEDEFFGHVKGAFTDAHQARVGRFEQAHGGTIFLDEIGDLPLELQPKLLRALQEREIHRIGGAEAIRLDFRVIAATNVDLWKRVEEGRFREDLFYRINVFHIHLPPLRERPDDIPLFAAYFLDKFSRRDGLPPKYLSPAAEQALRERPWRGNIRELENAVEIAVIRSEQRRQVTERDFPVVREVPEQNSEPAGDEELDFKTLVLNYERDLIGRALEATHGNKNRAAQLLKIKRTTLIEKLKRFENARL
jgi:transcriptional regulator with GAF, ATPase, and Fis domain